MTSRHSSSSRMSAIPDVGTRLPEEAVTVLALTDRWMYGFRPRASLPWTYGFRARKDSLPDAKPYRHSIPCPSSRRRISRPRSLTPYVGPVGRDGGVAVDPEPPRRLGAGRDARARPGPDQPRV